MEIQLCDWLNQPTRLDCIPGRYIYNSNSPPVTHFGKSGFLHFFLTLYSICLQKTNRELPNLEHALPKCVPKGLFESIYSNAAKFKPRNCGGVIMSHPRALL